MAKEKQALIKISEYQQELAEVLKKHKCKSASDIADNTLASWGVAFAVTQIGELSKDLSKETIDKIGINLFSDVRRVRNLIVHNYLNCDKKTVAAYALNISSKKSISSVDNAIKSIK